MFVRIGGYSIAVNMWNPIYAVTPFVLLLVSIPLAIFAVITTSFAITLLSARALIVYFQLSKALINAWLSPPVAKTTSIPYQSPVEASPVRSSPPRHRDRRTSIGSNASQDTITPSLQTSRLSKKSGSLTTLIGTSEMTRDFEGVGGWRQPGDKDEEALWMGMNSRLQLPADAPVRRHKRSLTGGASPTQRWSLGPESMRMSPVQSRVRTPVRFALEDEGYFPPQPGTSLRPLSTSSDLVKHHTRRKSGSSGSISSAGSAGLTMSIKEVGENWHE